MPISKDLLLAILSMDSYNRGTGAGIEGLSSEAGTTIGTATIGIDSSDDAGVAEDAGFYAIAYDTDYGTVISYRGTDFLPTEDLREGASFTRGDGSTGNTYEALFETDASDTIFRGERGVASNDNRLMRLVA